jgi:hypothetical protein
MTYQEQWDRYGDMESRGRYSACIREQAHLTFADDPDPANKSLAQQVISGNAADVDAVIAAICVGPNSATLDDDGGLLAAVQAAWPVTAGAMYGE